MVQILAKKIHTQKLFIHNEHDYAGLYKNESEKKTMKRNNKILAKAKVVIIQFKDAGQQNSIENLNVKKKKTRDVKSLNKYFYLQSQQS